MAASVNVLLSNTGTRNGGKRVRCTPPGFTLAQAFGSAAKPTRRKDRDAACEHDAEAKQAQQRLESRALTHGPLSASKRKATQRLSKEST